MSNVPQETLFHVQIQHICWIQIVFHHVFLYVMNLLILHVYVHQQMKWKYKTLKLSPKITVLLRKRPLIAYMAIISWITTIPVIFHVNVTIPTSRVKLLISASQHAQISKIQPQITVIAPVKWPLLRAFAHYVRFSMKTAIFSVVMVRSSANKAIFQLMN